jgi:ATP diphosphatase
VAAVGFDWARTEDVIGKIEEEVRELRAALSEHPDRATEELGDVLFSLANLSRKLGLEAESSLRQANDKFTRRFQAMEALFDRRGTPMDQAGLDALERAWQRVKARERVAPARARAPRPRARARG